MMQITVLLVLAVLILLCAVLGATTGEKYPWRWNVFAILVGLYVLIQQLPTGR